MCLLHLHHLHMCCRACVHLINAHIEDLRPCDKRPSMNPLLLAWSQCGSRNKSHRNPESKFKIGWERSWSPLVHLFLLLFSWGLRRGADMKTSPTAQSRVNRQMRDLIAGMAPYKLPHACYTVICRIPLYPRAKIDLLPLRHMLSVASAPTKNSQLLRVDLVWRLLALCHH